MPTITKRGNRYRAQVRVDGKSLSKTFTTRAEAAKWARASEVEIERGDHQDASRITLKDLMDEYRRLTTAKKAFGRSKDAALLAIEKQLGKFRLTELRTATFLKYAETRENEGAGPTTIGIDLIFLGTVVRHAAPAMGLEKIAAAVLAGLSSARATLRHSGRVTKSQERTRRPTEGELKTLFAHWADKPRMATPLTDLVLFAIASAMRLGEIVRLDWADLNEAARTIIIRQRKHPTEKASNDQTVPLLAGPCVFAGEVIDPLSIIKRQKTRWAAEGRIFPYNEKTVSTLFTRAVDECKIDDLHFHDLRHEAASLLFEAGYEVQQVALVTGHRDWNMLRRYTQIKPESLHREDKTAPDTTPPGAPTSPNRQDNVILISAARKA